MTREKSYFSGAFESWFFANPNCEGEDQCRPPRVAVWRYRHAALPSLIRKPIRHCRVEVNSKFGVITMSGDLSCIFVFGGKFPRLNIFLDFSISPNVFIFLKTTQGRILKFFAHRPERLCFRRALDFSHNHWIGSGPSIRTDHLLIRLQPKRRKVGTLCKIWGRTEYR